MFISVVAASQEGPPVRKTVSETTHGSEALRPAEPSHVLSPPKDFNLEDRNRVVLNHLNAVVRMFRLAVTPIQKVGEPSDMLYRDQALSQATQIADLAFESSRAEAALLSAFTKQTGAPVTLAM